MLNVPAPSFPVPSSQQRVSAGGRNKTPLKPGRSLMDWIQLKSGKDLTGLKGRIIEVTEQELVKHNTKTDCWICIRGLVYNVTSYMEYHPGGEEELMKAAGADGTQLFDQVHRWVNYESMLKECLVGRMAVKHVLISKGDTEERTGANNLNGARNRIPQETDKPFHPRYDWFQTDSTITVVIYTKHKNLSSDCVTVDYQENILRAEIIVGSYSYLLLIELSHKIQDFKVQCMGRSGKIDIILRKTHCEVWSTLGQLLQGNNSFITSSRRGLYYRKCRLASKMDVNHNTRLFCFELPQGCYLPIPVGHHVYLKISVSDTEIVKPYTPVSPSLLLDPLQPTQQHCIYAMIKIYPDGSFTSQIDQLTVGDYVSLSSPQGCFRTTLVEETDDIFLVAAGTGFTPMATLLSYALSSAPHLRKVKLLFFNKTEDDILWREQLEKLCLTDKRFEVQFVLSEPNDSWIGYKGQISAAVLSETITRSKQDSKVLTCICGPNGFVEQGIRFLEDLGFSQEELFVFRE